MLKIFKRYFFKWNTKSEIKDRNFYNSVEIFFNTPNILQQAMFSKKLLYFAFEYKRNLKHSTNFKNRCFKSGSYKSFLSRLSLSRISFAQKALSGQLVGFHRAIW
jgi:ribosomal protein S14